MSRTRWAVEGPDGNELELNGHKFGSNDDGAPMLCNLVCSAMGRHAHIDYCRSTDPKSCNDTEINHIGQPIEPNPGRPKDWISHKLYWRRLGFKGELIYLRNTFASLTWHVLFYRSIFSGGASELCKVVS